MNYKENYNEWINNPYFDEETKKELLSIRENEKEIEDRFYKNLEFGTGGLRGVIGAGSNRINKYTVRRATYGLANYILNKCGNEGKKKGVVIAYDSRHKSEDFCLETAKTLAACGIKAYIFDSLRPTPQLSFAVRHLNCVGGVVITASHNPPEYNGYKVYWSDGGQVCPEIAEKIINEVNKIEQYNTIPTTSEDDELIVKLDESIDVAFIDAVKKQVINQELINKVGKDLKIIYTPIHGTGNIPIRNVLDEVGFKNVSIVKEQELPDSNFSTVQYPNPEEKAVFDIAIEMAKKDGADLIIGTDPDCDRVGVVVKDNNGEYVVLNGNQVGSLLVDYVLSNRVDEIKTMNNPTIVKTIVTSELGTKIAKSYGVGCIDTLTGFKFIGEKIHQYENSNEATFIMGYEESYGYLVGTHARDKDGVVSALLISEMAAYYYDKGMSLYDGLQEVYSKYGYFKEELKSITLKGIDGMEQIKSIMSYFRNTEVNEIADIKVIEIKDYKNGIDDLPKSDVLKFILEDGNWIAVRPSGTEPKIKFYFGCNGENKVEVDNKLEKVKEVMNNTVDSILKEGVYA
ncbi:phospho-sugar mutase [Paraclostridium bifermentans]|uniref:phospho-sugar mutase n=1 Tax=Paraclostridium bifermentans TaxID=1490 RepID=UPI0019D4B5DA|nr:phospho-sugar mutase [Paraclostridium bifermentans]MBN8048021.1 phospho-sugar mutase [Paraclostridium bifermentans]